MKLPRPFVRLPVRFDAERLSQEVAALPASAWARHPTGFAGNTAARLISAGGGENDAVAGRMAPTAHLRACPYIQQLLASFGVVWSRSRLMRLAPGANVPEHADVNYHWFTRVRIHVPVWTQPGVLFYCGDQVVHMQAGEAWIFDNWRLHRVENGSAQERVHLVADTTGSAAFWQLVEAGLLGRPERRVPYEPGREAPLMLERFNVFPVMPPAEMEHLLGDLAGEVIDRAQPDAATPAVLRFRGLLAAFCHDWRQLWSLYADTKEGLPAYDSALAALRQQGAELGQGLCARTNRLGALKVLRARVQFALGEPPQAAAGDPVDDYGNAEKMGSGSISPKPGGAAQSARKLNLTPFSVRFERPVFVVAAPRSGSTLLFETLACTPQLWTVGGEAHWLVEGFPELCPGAPGIDSNRVEQRHATPALAQAVRERIAERLQDPARQPLPAAFAGALRFLEKTPKNALRIPFFDAVFPDALFIHLWRDPRQNLSSIIEAWKSGGWVTYKHLEGWDGPWSMLLPPGWQGLRGKPLEEVAAHQWRTANRIIRDDLAALAPGRSILVNYDEFLRDPAGEVRRLAAFAGVAFDAALDQRTARPLPLSRHTQTRPEPDKWRRNEAAIARVLPSLEDLWAELRAAQAAKR
jgi:hypothetical protein